MIKEVGKLKVKVKTKLEKYPDEVTQDEIDKGLVKPIEITETEEIINISEQQFNELQGR